MIFRSRGADGQVVMHRPPYAAGAYSVPDKTLAGLRSLARTQSFEEASAGREGMLRGYSHIQAFERDGLAWHLYQANGSEHCVEVAVVNGVIRQIEPVPPGRAWEIAVERDRALRSGIVYD